MEAIWFGMKLVFGLVLGLFALWCIFALIGNVPDLFRGVIDSLGAEQSSERRPIEWIVRNFEKVHLEHENKVRRLGNDMAAIERERNRFAWSLGLLDDPSGYHSEPAYYRYRYKYRQNGDIREYRFGVEGTEYTLLANEALQPCSSMPEEDRYYKHCSIHDKEGDLVFYTKLVYRENLEGDPDTWGPCFDASELEAFIPGMWVKCILQRMLEFRQEEEKQRARYQEEEKRRLDEERREKFLR